ncbi:SH3 domain-containing protein, partial [Natronospira sp.]
MNMKRWGLGLLLLWAGLALADDEGSAEQAAKLMYVQTHNAAVFEEPGLGGDPLSRLAQGDQVQVLESTERWYRVQQEDLEGWMPNLVLRDTPPSRRQSRADEAAELEASPRRRASAVTTAGAIRGVEEEERLLDDPDLDIEQLRALE